MVAMFAYYPLYGWFYAFFDYRPPNALSMKDFVGLKWFTYMASNPVRVQTVLAVLRNTLVMSGITLITSWLPMLFAVFLNEIKWMPYRKFVQTVTTLPNFISWVLVYSIAFNLFNSTGAVNSILQSLGVTSAPIMFLQDSKHV
jgi:putative aldouronate transport system permease protein